MNGNNCGPDGRSPLSLAALGGHDAMVRVLLERGADAGALDSHGRRPADLWSGDAATGAKLLGESSKPLESGLPRPVVSAPLGNSNVEGGADLRLLRAENAELKKIVAGMMEMIHRLETRVTELERAQNK